MQVLVVPLIYLGFSSIFLGAESEMVAWVVGLYKALRGKERIPNTPSGWEQVFAFFFGPLLIVPYFAGLVVFLILSILVGMLTDPWRQKRSWPK